MSKTFSFLVKITINAGDPLFDYYDDVAKDQLKHFIIDELQDADNLMEYECEVL